MHPIRSLILVAALLVIFSSASPFAVRANCSIETRAGDAGLWHSMPRPVVHLHCTRTALTFELGYRLASEQAGREDAVTRTIVIMRPGRVQFLFVSPSLNLAFPRRSA